MSFLTDFGRGARKSQLETRYFDFKKDNCVICSFKICECGENTVWWADQERMQVH